MTVLPRIGLLLLLRKNFLAENIKNTRFEGIVQLGISSGRIELDNNIFKTCGIYSSNINNCEIGNDVFISDVKDLSNYIVEENVAIIMSDQLQ